MYTKKAHIHFVGIGGIGMSGIATILKHQGYTISGCDLDLDQHSVKNLRALGCTIYHGNNTPQCNDGSIDILVYSSAVKTHNPEIIAAQQRGIPTIPRALMLAELMRTKYSIAVAGAHGKTTTTSLVAHIFMEAAKNPTVIIGGHLKNLATNAVLGDGDFLIAETDESDRSLTHLHPTLAIITNIDLEHLETYKDLDDIKDTFKHFISNIPFYGKAIVCTDDIHIRSLLPITHVPIIKYGTDANADIRAEAITLYPTHSTFDVVYKDTLLGTVHLAMPGTHNVLNALAAIAVSLEVEIPFATIALALSHFKGVDRRFTYKGNYRGAELFDDYGHHPNEIKATLSVAQKRTNNNVIVVFQPHRYTRTSALWHDFLMVFAQSSIKHLIITDIFPASEQPIPGITSERLAQELKAGNPPFSITYVPYQADFGTIIHQLDALIEPNDLVLLLGAGKMNKIVDFLPSDTEQVEQPAVQTHTF